MKHGEQTKIISLDNLSIGYRSNRKTNKIVKSKISASADTGELVALIGENGIGKSTLLKTIAGFQQPIHGELQICGKPIVSYTEKELALIMSFVSTEIIRVSNLTVFDLVSLGRFPHTNWFGKIVDQDRALIEEAIEAVGLSGFEYRMVDHLSDGERQKAMIARTLAQDTQLIVLDEPTAFLDLSNKYEIVHLLHRLAHEKGKTILFSTHDLTTAIAESDKLWLMLNDSIEQGAPEDLIMNGNLNRLFQNNTLYFDQQHGDFRIPRKKGKEVFVVGEGLALAWTIKALARNGFTQSDTAENGLIKITINYPTWSLSYLSHNEEFNSLFSLCRYLNTI